LPGAAYGLPKTERRKGAVQGEAQAAYAEAAEREREGQLWLRREGGWQPRRADRPAMMPRLPRVVAARPNPSTGELLEGREGSGAGQWDLASAGKRAQGCGGAGPRPGTGGRAGGEKNRGGARGGRSV
jgi:hypothetical protein